MVEIIKTKPQWDAILTELGSYDFYHTYDYHEISRNPGEMPVLLVYSEGEVTIALPLLIQKIFDTEFNDATSVYGYAGPLSKGVAENFDNSDFQKSLNSYFTEHKIISVFSRLNPYIGDQDIILKGFGSVKDIGNVVNIDLTKNLDEQRSKYRRDTRSRVNKARRLCSIKRAETKDDVLEFIAIYNETMTKLNAGPSYFFETDYFFDFIDCNGFHTDILLAVLNESNEVIAGSMFVKTNEIIQYHLSGTKSDFMKIAPARLLLDEMRVTGTEQGFTYFNLGGGYNSQEDALFDFKSSFSDDIKTFRVWNHIVDQEAYDAMSATSEMKETNFFPAYRAPK